MFNINSWKLVYDRAVAFQIVLFYDHTWVSLYREEDGFWKVLGKPIDMNYITDARMLIKARRHP